MRSVDQVVPAAMRLCRLLMLMSVRAFSGYSSTISRLRQYYLGAILLRDHAWPY